MRQLPRIPIEAIWVIIFITGIFVFVNTHPIRPHDFWFHAAAGREIVANGQIPAVDTFSYTAAGQPYESYKIYWLMEVTFYLLLQTGGIAGVVLFQSLVITAAYALVLLTAWRTTGNWRAATLAALCAAATGIEDWNVRPQAITILIGACYLLAISELNRGGKRLWLGVFPLGMVIWVNSHGSFVLGFALLAAWLAAASLEALAPRLFTAFQFPVAHRPIRTIAAAIILSGLACLLNPRGPGVLLYLSEMTTNPIVQNLVPEWVPPTIESQVGLFFFSVLLVTILLLAVSPRRPDIFHLLLFTGFTVLSFKTARGILWFGLTTAPLIAAQLDAIGQHWQAKLAAPGHSPRLAPVWINWAFVSLAVVAAFLSLPWFKELLPLPPAKAGLVSQETPTQATAVLMQNRWPGRLFHSMPFGSYLHWAAQPAYPVFVDSRIELFPITVWRDYLTIVNAQPGWEDKLSAYQVNTLMLSPTQDSNLLQAASALPNWQKVYQDDVAVILIRKGNE